MELRKLWLVPAAAFAFAGCAQEEGPLSPVSNGAEKIALECEVSVRDGLLSCSAPEGSGGSGSAAVLGDQGLHVQLTSVNTSYDSGAAVFSTDVSVRNLLDQTMGSSDGVSVHPEGVRIFFHTAPQVAEGSGTVSVRNADGQATFTAADQDYFQYDQAITPGGHSLPKTWEWEVSAGVDKFTFHVGVSARVPNETSIRPGVQIVAQRISADTFHTCVLDLEGNAYCWGSGGSGRLGNGTTSGSPTPVAVVGGIKFGMIETGHAHSCGIALDGTGYCWGSNGNGRLGHGTTGAREAPDLIADGHKWVHLSASSSTTCGVTVDGEGYCWGFGGTRLGDGISAETRNPSRVLDPPSGPVKWAMISSAHLSTCGLTTEGVVYCWGPDGNARHGKGEIGGSFDRPTEPAATSERFVYIDGKEQHFCGLTASGDAYCWGLNRWGELGIGTYGDTVATPSLVTGGHKFATIQTGRRLTCGLTFDGDAYCWGSAENGRLGNGENSTEIYPEPIPVSGGHKFRYLGTGITHACGVTMSGDVLCWGSNEQGQLGNGTVMVDHDVPTLVHNLTGIALFDSLPAASCGDGAESATCFPARRNLQDYSLALGAGAAVPQVIGRIPGPLAGA